jgi:CRISPR-associated endonuclease Cas1/CRISPR-associated protein Cas4
MPQIPARMVNEYQYCPRLAYLMWVQCEWAESSDTVEGRHVHRRVDRGGGKLPPAPALDEGQRIHARSVTLSTIDPNLGLGIGLGLIAKLDLVEAVGTRVTPVEYKRGKRPHLPQGAYDPERVQLCLQGLLLREHGYQCDEGILYFAASKERVRVEFDAPLIELTRAAVAGLREIAAGGAIPEPLASSPKCPRCSLVAICLPDEVGFLKHATADLRPLAVPRTDAFPLHVQARGGKVTKSGDTLEIYVDDVKTATARIGEVSQLVLMGNIYLTTPAMQELMSREIPITWTSHGGWFYGHTVGIGHKNVELRTAQYRASFEDAACVRIAQGLVAAKIRNQRTLLRRNWKDGELPEDLLGQFLFDIDQAERADSLARLLGIEGNAAARYFRHFSRMLRAPDPEAPTTFDFNTRNRRPPTDPVNALLSFAYSMLARSFTVTLSAIGFDPYRGFYHQPRYGRPALALDMMEPFRPLLADSVVLLAINNGEVRIGDFDYVAGACALSAEGRKRFIATFERRLDQEITHPLFGYKLSYRRLIELQSRLLGRHLLGEIAEYPNFITR